VLEGKFRRCGVGRGVEEQWVLVRRACRSPVVDLVYGVEGILLMAVVKSVRVAIWCPRGDNSGRRGEVVT
jgi:hypothetical protein